MTQPEIDYQNTSALDDALLPFEDEIDEDAEVVFVEDGDEIEVKPRGKSERRWYDDFRFDSGRGRDFDRIGSLWGKYGSTGFDAYDQMGKTEAKRALRLSSALKLVQGFVDTFATGDKPYRVAFTDQLGGSTSRAERSIVVSHLPLFDKSLSEDQANRVVTGIACHEASHVRYGKEQGQVAAIVAREDKRAFELSNILEDARIERRFAEDYPGFAGIFDGAIEYIGHASRERSPEAATEDGTQYDPSKLRQVAVAGLAIRYDAQTRWTPETQPEREWWQQWAQTYSADDSATLHEQGLRAGIAHLADEEKQGEGEGEGKGSDSSDAIEQAIAKCLNQAVSDAARNSDTLAKSVVDAITAQQIVEDTKQMEQTDDGNLGEIIRRVPQNVGRTPVKQDGLAVAAIRSAFARSRTGHWGTDRGHKQGRIDNRSLPRIAMNDHRLFAKRVAPSEGKYLIWLLVDCSGSMGGLPIQQASEVATALAAAARFLPNVSLTIWGWSDGRNQHSSRHLSPAFGATRVYSSGESLTGIGALRHLAMGGTPDRATLSWAAKAIRAETPRGTEPVIIIASDGAGSLAGAYYWGSDDPVRDLSKKYEVKIVSVAIGGGLDDFQRKAYGHNGFVRWAGSISKTAKPLGDLVARIASGLA